MGMCPVRKCNNSFSFTLLFFHVTVIYALDIPTVLLKWRSHTDRDLSKSLISLNKDAFSIERRCISIQIEMCFQSIKSNIRIDSSERGRRRRIDCLFFLFVFVVFFSHSILYDFVCSTKVFSSFQTTFAHVLFDFLFLLLQSKLFTFLYRNCSH
jgi:hypothetical protein